MIGCIIEFKYRGEIFMKINMKNIRYISIILILLYTYFCIAFFMKFGDFSRLIPTLVFFGVSVVFGLVFLFLHLRYRCPHCNKPLKSMLYHRPDICSHCSKEIDWEKIDREL